MSVALHPQPTGAVNLISLCTGGGGLDLGIELALPAARAVAMVEREAFAVAHLVAAIEKGLLAPAAIWSDVSTFDGRPWRGLVDGVVGGIPCQPHSLAGKKRGSLDERDLWSAARRIIVQARPWFVLIENVRGMLSAGADQVAGAERVLRDLRRLGYTVECGLFTAAETGASHLRPRVFILAVADARCAEWRAGDDGRCEPDRPKGGRHEGAGGSRQPGEDVADAERDGRRQGYARTEFCGWAPEPDEGSDGALADTGSPGRQGSAAGQAARSGRQGSAAERDCGAVADTDIAELRGQPSAGQQPVNEQDFDLGLYPPGPSDFDGWRRVLAHSPDLKPSVRRMADGLAARLDLSGPHAARVERLRMLGNGVVSLEGAYAFRTLVSRLASTGHAGAVQLVRLMGAAE